MHFLCKKVSNKNNNNFYNYFDYTSFSIFIVWTLESTCTTNPCLIILETRTLFQEISFVTLSIRAKVLNTAYKSISKVQAQNLSRGYFVVLLSVPFYIYFPRHLHYHCFKFHIQAISYQILEMYNNKKNITKLYVRMNHLIF